MRIWTPPEKPKPKAKQISDCAPDEMLGDAVRIAAVCNRSVYVTRVRCARGHEAFWCIRFEESLWQDQTCVTPMGEVLETEVYT